MAPKPSVGLTFPAGGGYIEQGAQEALKSRMALSTPHLSEIPDEGLSLVCAVLPEELKLEPSDARVRGEFDLSADIAKDGTELHVRGVLAGTFVRQCVRCLTDFEEPASIPFTAEYRGEGAAAAPPEPTRGKAPGGREGGEPAARDDEDIYPLVGDRLELSDMLREQIILATPMQPLCREDCRGLCPVCGENLNERRCDCPPQRPDSPFSVLRKLKDAGRRGAGA